jgi:hypothetical protein
VFRPGLIDGAGVIAMAAAAVIAVWSAAMLRHARTRLASPGPD